MSNTPYSDSLEAHERFDMWDFATNFPSNPFLSKEATQEASSDTQHIIRAILAGAEAVRVTVMEESAKIQEAIKGIRR